MISFVVDDNATSLSVHSRLVERIIDGEVRSFTDPLKALSEAGAVLPDLVLVDFIMPGLDGVTFIRRLRAIAGLELVPVVMITSESDRKTRIEALEAGATDFISKPVEPVELKARLRNLVELRIAQKLLNIRAAERAKSAPLSEGQSTAQQRELMFTVAGAIATRSGEPSEHPMRVAEIARLMALELGFDEISARYIEWAAAFHDIGMIGLPDAVVRGEATAAGADPLQRREHATIGGRFFESSPSPLVRLCQDVALSHHERWNGSGYPSGSKGQDIPIAGRIVAVADAFDERLGRTTAVSDLERVKATILEGAGTEFDPSCVAAFSRAWAAIQSLYRKEPTSIRLVA